MLLDKQVLYALFLNFLSLKLYLKNILKKFYKQYKAKFAQKHLAS